MQLLVKILRLFMNTLKLVYFYVFFITDEIDMSFDAKTIAKDWSDATLQEFSVPDKK